MPLSTTELDLIKDCAKDETAEARLIDLFSMMQSRIDFFESLVENSPDIIACFDSELRHTYINTVATRVFDMPVAQFIGKTPAELHQASGLNDMVRSGLREAWDTGHSNRHTFSHDGEHHYEILRQPLCDEQGKVQHLVTYTRDITRLKQVQDELDEKRALLQAVLDAIPDAVYVKDRDGRFTLVNHAILDHHVGLTIEDIIGRTDLDLYGQEAWDRFRPDEERILNKGAVITREIYAVNDPDPQWYLIIKTPLRGEDDSIIGVVGLNQNIHQLKVTELELRESQQFAEQITRTIPHLVYIVDILTGENIYINPAIQPTLGYTIDQIHAMGTEMLSLILHPLDRAEQLQTFERFQQAQDGEIIESEYRFRHADGSWRWMHLRETIFQRTLTGQPQLILGVCNDVTERRQMLEKLAESNRRYYELVENIPVMVFRARTFPDGQWAGEYISPYCEELTGIPAESALTNPNLLLDQIHEEDRPRHDAASAHSVRTCTPFNWTGRHWRNGELRWKHVQTRPELQSDGSIIWNGVQVDVTGQQQAEAALREREQLQTILEKEREMSVLKSRIMQSISHEFRTPLSVIISSTELIRRYFERMTQEQYERHFTRISEQVFYIAHLLDEIGLVVNNPFTLAQSQPALLDFPFILRQTVDEIQQKTDHIITATHHPAVRFVQADSDALNTVTIHLLNNAIKFSPPDTPIYIHAGADGRDLVLSVRDRGIGIVPAERTKVFAPLFRGSNIGEIRGLGMGLTIVKNIVDLYEGSVHIDSVLNHGTTITLRLPILAS